MILSGLDMAHRERPQCTSEGNAESDASIEEMIESFFLDAGFESIFLDAIQEHLLG